MRKTERRRGRWGDLFRKECLNPWSMAKRLIISASVPRLSEWPRQKRSAGGRKALSFSTKQSAAECLISTRT